MSVPVTRPAAHRFSLAEFLPVLTRLLLIRDVQGGATRGAWDRARLVAPGRGKRRQPMVVSAGIVN